MATTKIWAIKNSVNDALKYIANSKKTKNPDLELTLSYAGNKDKTVLENEEVMYVTGVNCNRETAYEEMKFVQKRFNKTTGNVAYHAYQSFKTGEVTPKQAHDIGVKLARLMWGSDYQVLVATHFNTGTYHNHFVVNSVNMWTGKKFNCDKKAYYQFRYLSDKLCEENDLTVIKNPKGKTPRSIYFAEKSGRQTKYNLMRQAIDEAMEECDNIYQLADELKLKGYIVNATFDSSYSTIRSVNSKKAVRFKTLGEDYEYHELRSRLKQKQMYYGFNETRKDYKSIIYNQRHREKTPIYFNGSIKRTRKVTGLKALYFRYCYALGYLPKNKNHKPLSPEMREAWLKIDRISDEINLVSKENLNDLSDVKSFIDKTEYEIKSVENYRSKIYNKLKRCTDDSEREKLFSKRDECTSTLKILRKQKKIAKNVLTDNSSIKNQLQEENLIKSGIYSLPTKSRYRERER